MSFSFQRQGLQIQPSEMAKDTNIVEEQMNLNWIKCEGNLWCPFLTLNIGHIHFSNLSGVYVIWHSGNDPATVYVGKGNIAERIQIHRNSEEILRFSHLGLFVVWAEVALTYQEGVERYLADSLKPKIGERYPNVTPIAVNFPWS